MSKVLVFWLRISQFAIALAIFTFAALMPAKMAPVQHSAVSLHFIGNLLLFLSAWVACYGRLKIWLVILLLIPYSLLIEFAQWLSPSRTVDPKDMVVNLMGLLAGLVLVYVFEWLVRVKQRRPG